MGRWFYMFECYLWGWCKVTIFAKIETWWRCWRVGSMRGADLEDTPNTDRLIGSGEGLLSCEGGTCVGGDGLIDRVKWGTMNVTRENLADLHNIITCGIIIPIL